MPDGMTGEKGAGAAIAAGAATEAVQETWGGSRWESGIAAGIGGGGGGFRFPSEEELGAIIIKWEDELEEIVKDRDDIDYAIDALVPPGEDSVSKAYTGDVVNLIRTLVEQNDTMRDYAEGYIEKLKEAKRAHAGQEDANEDSFSGDIGSVLNG